MKKILKSFTFWFFIFGLFIVYMNIIGQDPYYIVTYHSTQLLRILKNWEFGKKLLQSGPMIKNVVFVNGVITNSEISLFYYIIVIIDKMFYGIVLDLIKHYWVKKRLVKGMINS